ncbi:hypothetical protein [Natronoglomus mannanivorans]|uniref:Uncharacterized protein n=1 Tax=Natronoglomus mannanivorans TaxID=2979990 RepID=A0AAP2YZD3_9EURY|nr:hypothetical protein [Halobacteria archaeon AArc-xg1-1]
MDLTRRQLLAGAVGGTAAVGGGRAIYNVFLGYDRFTGTNLLRQDLDPMVASGFRPSEAHVATVDGYRIEQHDGVLSVADDSDTESEPLETLDPATDDPADAAAVDAELGLSDGPLEELVADLSAIESGNVRFVYDSYPAFFDLIAEHDARPYTVSAVRGYRDTDPDLVADFTGADPHDPEAVVEGLVDGFREHTNYDIERYLAGSVEDNVLFGARDLRQHFESETDFEAILAGEDTGLFCYELTRRSVDALQAVPAPDQTAPVVGGFVKNDRHKHVYTIVASVVRGRAGEDGDGNGDEVEDEDEDGTGDLIVPVTFLDYTHSTLYDDLRMRRILGDGLDAYDDGHRATGIHWYQ